MKTIWKFQLNPGVGLFAIDMPSGAKILTVQCQNDVPVLWAEVNTENPLFTRWVRVFGTGREIDDISAYPEYIGTYQMGPFVGHVYE